jgi:hypothetical protein
MGQILILHHYLGTWEQFSFRQDPRVVQERSPKVSFACFSRTESFPTTCWQDSNVACVELFGQRFLVDAQTNETHRAHDTIGWLDGFIHQVGAAKAAYYLEGAGIVEHG